MLPGEKPESILFEVKDTGIGIELDRWDRIFESFVQGDASTTRRHGGTGLGLSISRSLVDLMGGWIQVHSLPGEGSEFSFEIQLPPAPDSQRAVRSETPRPTGDAPEETAPPLRILLAEDNADNQLLFRALLKKYGHQIQVAETGAQAVQAVREGEFDIIFMDIQMPEMDGLTATRLIREYQHKHQRKRARIPIYALSAHAMQEDVTRSMEAGCDGHLTKPIRRTELLDVLVAATLRAE